MRILVLLLFSFAFSQSLYNGLVNYRGQVVDCGHVLNKYAHKGVPSIREDKNVKICCSSLREILKNEGANDLLIAHLRICRQLGR